MQGYRSEIDGLRSLAVIPVILFHAGVASLPGGFVGVDIFFVISGYLITSIIAKELAAGKFSVVKFYERRARRILPALFFVLACCIPFAIYLGTPDQISLFGKSVVAATLSVSNILFWKTENYFAPASDQNILIHTWSLGVEEQFYVVFPIVLALTWRLFPRHVGLIIWAGLIASLGLSQWASTHAPTSNFYLIPTRAWELLVGSVAALSLVAVKRSQAEALSIAGLVLIAMSLVLFSAATPFPSVYALVPTVGTALVLKFGTGETLVGRFLSFRPFVAIGLISYSAYLWHQPLFAFARMRSAAAPSVTIMLALAVLTLVLAWLSWRYVEAPFRRPAIAGGYSQRLIFKFSAVGAAALVLVGIGLWQARDELSPYAAPQYQAAVAAQADGAKYMRCLSSDVQGASPDEPCSLGDPTRPSLDFLLIGDSFGASYADGISAAAEKKGLRGAILATGGCPPVLGIGGDWPQDAAACERLQDRMLAVVKRSGVKDVFLSAAWGALAQDRVCKFSRADCVLGPPSRRDTAAMLKTTIESLRSAGAYPVIITEPPRFAEGGPSFAMKSLRFRGQTEAYEARKPSQVVELLDLAYPRRTPADFAILDMAPGFCGARGCAVFEAGEPITWDKFHVTARKSRQLMPLYDGQMTRIAGREK